MIVEDEGILLKVPRTKTKSVDQFERDSPKINRLRKRTPPDKPCHNIRDSLLNASRENTDYRGIISFCVVLVVISTAHVAIENIIKHGILIDPIQLLKVFCYKPTESPCSLILIGLNVFALSSLGTEILLSKGLLSEKFGLRIITTLVTLEILLPAIIVYLTDCHVVPAIYVMCFVVTIFLKLASYHITNYGLREPYTSIQKVRQRNISSNRGRRKDVGHGNMESNLVHYPDNLNLKDLYYFLFAPTLCYELNFSRTDRIRKIFVVKRVLEVMFLIFLASCIVQQCIVPEINDSVNPIEEMDLLRTFEKLLKLTTPNIAVCLMLFYCFYYSYLNALAEILRFEDRHFFDDFWNSGTVAEFWQNWNILVSKWCLRHLYVPFRHWGFTNSQTSAVVFFVSGAFHEYIFIAPLKMFRIWAFLVMTLPVPYSIVVEKYLPHQYTNIVGWMFFINAISLCNLLYYYDYYSINYKNVEAAL